MADDYFPLEPGLKLEYRAQNASGSGTLTIEVVSVARREEVVKARCRRTSRWGKSARAEEYDVLKDATGVYSGAEPEFPLPVKLGRAWEKYPRDYSIEELDGVTTVPAGTFRGCLKVGYRIAGGDAGTGSRWYAPGVGFVREVCADETDPYEFVLLKRRRGKTK